METSNSFKHYKDYKGFKIFSRNNGITKDFFAFKLTENKKVYEFRTKDYKTLKSLENSIDKYLDNK